MSKNLCILLIIFSLILFSITLILLKKKKIPVSYSMVWLITSFILFIVSVFPNFINNVTHMMGFEATSNMVIGIILCLLLFITMVLTIIVSKQNRRIILLIQELSILKEKKEND